MSGWQDTVDWLSDAEYSEQCSEYPSRSKYSRGPAQQMCIHCGEHPLFWKETDRGWRLVTAAGNLHTCQSYYNEPEVI